MARVELTPRLAGDLDRILQHLEQHAAPHAASRISEIVHAIEVLAHSPLIGRSVSGGNRELVIGRKAHGYVALYRYVDKIDTVFVLAVRSQREAGYTRP